MKNFTGSFLFVCMTSVIAFSQGINKYEIHFNKVQDSAYINLTLHVDEDYSHLNYFLFSENMVVQTLKVNQYAVNYSQNQDTIFVHNDFKIDEIEIKYSIPLKSFSLDEAIIFRRESKWYPHRRDELLTAKIYIHEPSCYIVCGQDKKMYQEVDISNELHLMLLPKDMYIRTSYTGKNIPFYFYRNKIDTAFRKGSYFQEFIDSYDHYVSFFEHTLSKEPLHIVEIFNEGFQMCQSLKNMTILGHIFYQIYLLSPSISWIPHEVAHQWWGNRLFCVGDTNRRFLEESITEYIAIQYLKNNKEAYEELLKSYADNIQKIENNIPIKNIMAFDSQDAGFVIYNLAPFLLEKLASIHTDYQFNSLLKTVFHNFEKKKIDYQIFINQIDNAELRKALEDLVAKNELEK
jgi:hypothetical protein